MRELGALIRISAPSISAWETGKTNPTFENLSTVADLLAISFEWLCTGKGDMDLIVYEEIPLFEKMSAEWQETLHGIAELPQDQRDDLRQFIDRFVLKKGH